MIKDLSTVKRETLYISAWELVLSAIMQAVFLLLGRWDITVLLGNLLGGSAAVLNFFLMGLTVEKSLDKEEKEARKFMQLSQTARSFMLFLAAIFGAVLDCFNIISSLLPLLFPRFAVQLRMFTVKKETAADGFESTDNTGGGGEDI